MAKITHIGDNSLTYIFTLLRQYVTGIANKKVDKVAGKQLSTNDYTTAEKDKLAGVDAGAQVNVIETIKVNGVLQEVVTKGVDITITPSSDNNLTNALKAEYDAAYQHSLKAHAPADAQANIIETINVNGTALVPTAKAVNIAVPTKVSQLTNDSNYLTSIPAEYVTDAELTAKNYQTAAQVDASIQKVVAAAPAALDTLNEIAAALNNDANFAGTMTTELAKKANIADFAELTNQEIQNIWDSVVV